MPGKRTHMEGYVPRNKGLRKKGWTKRALADTPGPVGERLRKEADVKYRKELDRMHARERLKRAVKHLAEVTKDSPMLSAAKLIAEGAQLEILCRLEENPEGLAPSVLTRMADSAINTVARMEQWDRKRGDNPTDALAAITSKMLELKGKLKIEVSVEPDAETIDVTPVTLLTP